MFEALAAGADSFAAAKAAEVRCDLTKPYLMLCAEPPAGREQGSGEWRSTAEALGRQIAKLAAGHSAVEAGPGPVRALITLGSQRLPRIEELMRACRELGNEHAAAIGVSEPHSSPSDATRAYRQATDATLIARSLLGGGGAISYADGAPTAISSRSGPTTHRTTAYALPWTP